TLPGCIVIFEPLIGERIVWHPTDASDLDAARQQFEEQWKGAYGHLPSIYPTVSVATAIQAIADELGSKYAPELEWPAQTASRDALDQARRLAEQFPRTPGEREEQAVGLHSLLEVMVADPKLCPVVQRHLARTHPMSLQGGPREVKSVYVIED